MQHVGMDRSVLSKSFIHPCVNVVRKKNYDITETLPVSFFAENDLYGMLFLNKFSNFFERHVLTVSALTHLDIENVLFFSCNLAKLNYVVPTAFPVGALTHLGLAEDSST